MEVNWKFGYAAAPVPDRPFMLSLAPTLHPAQVVARAELDKDSTQSRPVRVWLALVTDFLADGAAHGWSCPSADRSILFFTLRTIPVSCLLHAHHTRPSPGSHTCLPFHFPLPPPNSHRP